MALIDFDVEIKQEVSLRSKNVLIFIGTTPNPPSQCTTACPGHYMITMSVTPRPPDAWAALGDSNLSRPNAMGDLMLIPPGYAQHGGFRPQPGERKDIFCLFPQQQFEALMGSPIEWTGDALYGSSDVRDANIRMAVRRLAQEACTPGLASSVLIDSIATALAVDIRRYFSRETDPEEKGIYKLSHRQLINIRDFVYANSDQDLCLSDFANLCGLSVRHLTRAFRMTTGTTLAQHITDVRLDLAKQMLSTTRMPTKLIAAKVGFASTASFSTSFRRLTGTTPGAYRKRETSQSFEEHGYS